MQKNPNTSKSIHLDKKWNFVQSTGLSKKEKIVR